MNDLAGKIALVTGSSRGIGRVVALALAEAGVDVAIPYRERADAAAESARSVEAIGRRAVVVQAEVSDPEAVDRMASDVQSRLGPVDILVHNAGAAHPKALDDLTVADFDLEIATNLRSGFLVARSVLPAMGTQGWIGSSSSRFTLARPSPTSPSNVSE